MPLDPRQVERTRDDVEFCYRCDAHRCDIGGEWGFCASCEAAHAASGLDPFEAHMLAVEPEFVEVEILIDIEPFDVPNENRDPDTLVLCDCQFLGAGEWGLCESCHAQLERECRLETKQESPHARIADLEMELKTLHDIFRRQVEQERKRLAEMQAIHETEVAFLKSQLANLRAKRGCP